MKNHHTADLISTSTRSAFSRIKKRDGRLVSFDSSKIAAALLKAGQATGEYGQDVADRFTSRVLKLARARLGNTAPNVEAIQDIVEETLLGSEHRKTAKAYILYRAQHAAIRQMVKQANVDLVDRYLGARDWRVRENSNADYSLQGLNNYAFASVAANYWLNKIYPPEIRHAHESGDFHIHDLGFIAPYCVGWNLWDLLVSGFKGAPGKAEIAPPGDFRSALNLVVIFLCTLQGEAAGAQAFSSMDTRLAPFIRKDGLSYDEVKRAVRQFVINLNVPTRVGFQMPFTNLSLDLRPPTDLAGESAIVEGALQGQTYGDFRPEMEMFNRALLEVLTDGDAKGRPFSFPIVTYNITPDFDWDSPIARLLCEATAKYGIPYFANYVNSGLDPRDVRSMCCRLRLDVRSLQMRGGGLFGASPLTGSVGVVTINMPRLAYLARDEDGLMARLDELLAHARSSLEIKRKVIEEFTEKGLYPYTKFYLRKIKQRSGRYWDNHFSTIGLVGMNEACLNFLGEDIGTPAGKALAGRILDHMREKLLVFQEETANMYNLEATPAESTAYRLARIDQREFPDILCANETQLREGAEPFYTNSSHLPVNYSDDIFRVLELQDDLQCKYTGGTVLHVFVGESSLDPRAVRSFVKKVCGRYRLPYFTISPTFSVCPSHGYLGGEHGQCPNCGEETEVYSRVVGYLRPVRNWNAGKQAEFAVRKLFRIGEGT